MIIDDELKIKLMDFGALNYSDDKIMLILDINETEYDEILNSGGSKILDHGKALFEFQMEKKLMDMALSGDIKAMAEIKKKKILNGN